MTATTIHDIDYIIIIFEHIPHDYIPLIERIKQSEYIDEQNAKEIFFQLVIAINHIHLTDNFIHGDLNCKNIYINSKNEILLVSLGIGFDDFGISKG